MAYIKAQISSCFCADPCLPCLLAGSMNTVETKSLFKLCVTITVQILHEGFGHVTVHISEQVQLLTIQTFIKVNFIADFCPITFSGSLGFCGGPVVAGLPKLASPRAAFKLSFAVGSFLSTCSTFWRFLSAVKH